MGGGGEGNKFPAGCVEKTGIFTGCGMGKRRRKIKIISCHFLLPFCNYLYIMVFVVVFGHNMLHFDGQERCYDSFNRR